MDNIKDLAKSKLIGYIAGVLYLIGFISLALKHTVVYIVIFAICFILLIVNIVYEWKFIVKTLWRKKE